MPPEPFSAFSSACERLIFSMENRPIPIEQARIIEYYCKEILDKIAPYLPNRPPTKGF